MADSKPKRIVPPKNPSRAGSGASFGPTAYSSPSYPRVEESMNPRLVYDGRG